MKAGFPSLAEDIREKLDLIKLQVKHRWIFGGTLRGSGYVGYGLHEVGAIPTDNK